MDILSPSIWRRFEGDVILRCVRTIFLPYPSQPARKILLSPCTICLYLRYPIISVHFLLLEQFRRTLMKPTSPPVFVRLVSRTDLPARFRFLARPQLLTRV